MRTVANLGDVIDRAHADPSSAEINGFRRFLAIAGPPAPPGMYDEYRRGERPFPCGHVRRVDWPWHRYARGETGPPPRLWWLDDPTDGWKGGDQA